MRLYIDSPSSKSYTLGFQAQPLLNRRIPGQPDLSTCA
jgi:hypothetical protein